MTFLSLDFHTNFTMEKRQIYADCCTLADLVNPKINLEVADLCGRFVGLTVYFLARKGSSGILVCTVWLPCPQMARKTPRP